MEHKRCLLRALVLALVVPLAMSRRVTASSRLPRSSVWDMGAAAAMAHPAGSVDTGTAAAIVTAVTAGAAATTMGAIVMEYTPAEAIATAGIATAAIMALAIH
jgi:hypothetical protein